MAFTDHMTSPPPAARRGVARVPLNVQLGAAISTLVGLVMVSGIVAITLVVRLGDDGVDLGNSSSYSEAVASAALNAKAVANDERGYLMTGERHFLSEAEGRMDRANLGFDAAESAATTDAQRRAVVSSRTQFQLWTTAVQDEFSAYQLGSQRRAIELAVGPNRSLRKRYERSLAVADGLAVRDVARARHSVTHVLSLSIAILIACLLTALVMAVAIGVWLSRAIVRPMQRLLVILGDPNYVRLR